jgi:radical SAM superfamily enzyme YgiQ (UPF0313 family)
MNKGLNKDIIKDKIKLIKKKKFFITGFFILGYLDETPAQMLETVNFAKSLPCDIADFSNFLPLPGTPVSLKLSGNARRQKIDYDNLTSPANVIMVSGNQKEKKIRKKLLRKAYLEFYLRPHILINIFRKIRNIHQTRFIFKRVLRYCF